MATSTKTHGIKVRCLATRDEKSDAIAFRDDHAAKLRIMGLTPRYGVGLVRGRGRKSHRTWQVWLFDHGEDDHA